MKELFYDETKRRALSIALLILLAVVSIVVFGRAASSVTTHAATIESIDEKVDTVKKLAAASAVVSAGVSAIPGDTATPIAEKLADFTEYFLLILCVLYAEKYSITLIGTAAFRILIPIALFIWGIAVLRPDKAHLKRLVFKLVLFALAIYWIIPVSVRVSDRIYNTYEDSINSTISAAEDISEETGALSDAQGDEGLIQNILSTLSETASGLTERVTETLNRFVEALAVIIVTSCVIPLLVLVFFIWAVKTLTGIEFHPEPFHRSGLFGRGRRNEDHAPRQEPED